MKLTQHHITLVARMTCWYLIILFRVNKVFTFYHIIADISSIRQTGNVIITQFTNLLASLKLLFNYKTCSDYNAITSQQIYIILHSGVFSLI